jgi:transcriptional regulator GlxA family with amidase domain
MPTIGIVLFDNVEELDFVGPFEMFGISRQILTAETASAETIYNPITVAESTATPIRCGKGLRVVADYSYDDHPPLDVVVVPGGADTRAMAGNTRLVEWLRIVAQKATWITSVCTGVAILHKAGLTKGKRVATNWMFEDELEAMGDVKVVRDAGRFIVDGKVVTSQGVSAGIDMSLWLIGKLHSLDHARVVQRGAQYYPDPPYADK